MANTFKEELANKYQKAEADFQKAKEEAIRDIERMEAWQAAESGAAYISRIERVTAAAARVMELGQLIRAFQYYNPEEGPVLSEE